MVESANLGLELRKRVTHNFSTLRARSLQYKQDLISQVSHQNEGAYSPTIPISCLQNVSLFD